MDKFDLPTVPFSIRTHEGVDKDLYEQIVKYGALCAHKGMEAARDIALDHVAKTDSLSPQYIANAISELLK